MKSICSIFIFLLFAGCAGPGFLNVQNQQDLNAYIHKRIVKAQGKPTVIKIPNGTYHFYEDAAIVKELYVSNHDQDNPKRTGIYLDGIENITLDGNGSTFIFHGNMLLLVLRNSKNTVLRNFIIDFALPHIRQIEILEVDTARNESVARVYPSGHYEVAEGKLIFTDGERRLHPQHSMVFNADGRLAYRRADVRFNPEEVQETGADSIRIFGWDQNKLTRPGERFALRTYHRPTPGIFLEYNKNTSLENITVHYAEGMGLLAQLCENIHLNGFSVSLKEKDKRYFTTQADATHFSSCKGVIVSENGLYEGMADDAINVHGTYLNIIKRVNDNTVQAKYMHGQSWGFLWGEKGDTVQFIESRKMDPAANRLFTIKDIRPVDMPTVSGAKIFEIQFNDDLPKEISEKGKFGIENLTWTPEVIFRKNIIRNNRARGTLFSTPKRVICEDNLFDHTHGAAILLAGDCNGWYETGSSREVIIRNNRFINALTAYYQFTNAIISIYPEIPELEKQETFFHSNILIENNIFETFDKPILYAKSTDGLVFQNNTIRHNTEFAPFHWNSKAFLFEKVRNVKIFNNKFDGGFEVNRDVEVKFSGAHAVSVEENEVRDE